jgi:hypothetical protein
MLPVSDIKHFLNKKWNITNYFKNIDSNFTDFIKEKQIILNNNFIDNKYIKVTNLKENWFKIYHTIFDINWKIKKYYLSSKSWDTQIRVWNHIYLWNEDLLKNKDINSKISKLFDENDTKVMYKNINIKNKNHFLIIKINKKTKYVFLNFQYNWNTFVIEWSLNNIDEIKKAIKIFIWNTTYKNSKYQSLDKMDIYWLEIKKSKYYSIENFVTWDWYFYKQWILKFYDWTYWKININSRLLLKWDEDFWDTEKLMEWYRKIYYDLTNFEQNKNWVNFVTTNYTPASFKRTEFSFISYIKTDDYIVQHMFTINVESYTDDRYNDIYDFINSIELINWNINFYKKDSLKTSKEEYDEQLQNK